MIAVNIVGLKKSGKTTLAEGLIQALKAMGKKVVAAKFTSHPHADKEGTDTARLLSAVGPDSSVTYLAGGETAMFWGEKKFLPDLMPLLQGDVLVIEGGKELGWLPRVLLPREVSEAGQLSPELALASYGEHLVPGLPAVTDLGDLARLVLTRGFILPGLDCGSCGRPSCRELAVDIVAGRARAGDCAATSSSLTVRVNGHPLGMNPFVERIMAATLRGLLSELKGYAPGRIDISVEP